MFPPSLTTAIERALVKIDQLAAPDLPLINRRDLRALALATYDAMRCDFGLHPHNAALATAAALDAIADLYPDIHTILALVLDQAILAAHAIPRAPTPAP